MPKISSFLNSKPSFYDRIKIYRYFSSIIHIKLPDLGEGTKEATLKEWFVEKGSEINEFEDLWEVFTDKLVAQIPSTHKGVVKNIYFGEDEICPVGSTLADIEIHEDGEQPSQEKAVEIEHEIEETTAADTPITSVPSEKPKVAGGKILATPATRHYAKTLNVDITKISGSGKEGRVTNQDIDDFLNTPAEKEPAFQPSQPLIKPQALKHITEKDKVTKITAIK